MALAWDRFASLDGAPDRNFELLCRALVQRNHGRFGQLRSRRHQPGVEFHLKLEADCELGEAGRWFGWQCRWYDLPSNHSLGKRRRAEIVEAIGKAKADIPELTDFVLCLHELPAKADVDWYFSLDVGLRMHLWADEEIEARLTGDAAILRSTYFGELVLTADQLAETQARMIAPLEHRWVPGLNVRNSVERKSRVALAQPEAGDALREEAARLDGIADVLWQGAGSIDDPGLQALSRAVTADIFALSNRLKGIADACGTGRPGEARELIGAEAAPATSVREVRRLARRLRARRSRLALAASTVEADIRHALDLAAHYREAMTSLMIAVIGDAGSGKTQLSAELTARSCSGHAGVFLRGSDLRAGGTLDELAARLAGINAATFDELLEAADAAGARNGVRIPIVIDGLNDAERPSEWRTHLAQIMPILDRYDHVLLIVTLRRAVRGDVLPGGSLELDLTWEETEVDEAVARYFDHYRIDPGSARLPMGLFGIPLFLRMFCEAVNPERAKRVGVEAIPSSLVAIFELYRDQTANRLRTRPGHPEMPLGHIEKQLARIAIELWRQGARDLTFEEVKELVDGPGITWNDSLVRALEEEGILFRDSRSGWTQERSAIVFDRFAGYLIADAITRGLRMDELDEELSSAELWAKLRGSPEQRHPLAEDVLVALVGLLPRRFFGRQLWPLAPKDTKDWALAQTLDLESKLLDKETLDALEELIQRTGPPRWRQRHPLDRLWEVRDGVDHQLNARFLDRVLSGMSVAERDLRWTEWIRANGRQLLADLDEMESQWVASDGREDRDDLNARAVAWLLTSTMLPLRDRATRALQRYGRAEPARLFALTSGLLDVNDPYVMERLLAASFGAATAHQMPDPGGVFERALAIWLEELDRRYLDAGAESPTSHQLARQYISGCFELAETLHPAALPTGVNASALNFASGPAPEPIGSGDAREEECNQTFGMDFENYVVGPLFEGRGNYQEDHPAFVAGLAEVRGRVWELGWRSAAFSEIDKVIASEQWRRHESPDRTERYGKKYGWIGYYELAGRLHDRGELRDRTWTLGRGVWPDIDPTFPEAPPHLEIALPAWASTGPAHDATWYRDAEVDVPDALLIAETLKGEPGPWVLVEGWIEHRDRQLGRRVWGLFRGVLVRNGDADSLATQLKSRPYLGNDFVPEAPSDHGTFAGEIPWSAHFGAAGDMENDMPPYHAGVTERWSEPGIEIELLGHNCGIEASRTTTSLASGYWVPSHSIAAKFDLRQRPGTLDLVGLDGRSASLTLTAPTGFEGKLLYIRRDLLADYAGARRLVQLAWGERQVDVDWINPPSWVEEVRSKHADLWRRVEIVDL